MAAKRKVDWDCIESDWRAGVKSAQQIADEYTRATGVSITKVAIRKHFTALGVPRDLSAKVRAKADAMVSVAMVSGMVSSETTAKEAEIIDANATKVATIQIAHRTDIQRARGIAMTLLAELEAQTDNNELFEQLGEMLANPNANGVDKLNEAYRKVLSMPGRVDSMKKLAETLRVLIDKEREAFGLVGDGDNSGKDNIPLEDRLKKYAQDAAIEAASNVVRMPKAA